MSSIKARFNMFLISDAKVRRIYETRVNISENLLEKANYF